MIACACDRFHRTPSERTPPMSMIRSCGFIRSDLLMQLICTGVPMMLATFRGWLTGNVDRSRPAGYRGGAQFLKVALLVEGGWSQKPAALSAYASACDTAVITP